MASEERRPAPARTRLLVHGCRGAGLDGRQGVEQKRQLDSERGIQLGIVGQGAIAAARGNRLERMKDRDELLGNLGNVGQACAGRVVTGSKKRVAKGGDESCCAIRGLSAISAIRPIGKQSLVARIARGFGLIGGKLHLFERGISTPKLGRAIKREAFTASVVQAVVDLR